ncbi:pentapeptide repeat-containing protein [Allokutzneria oryzae]|uniref:Pentapeptide repeat-containing protein n=1 Tax=Allokutzneria oryzae TaxID=1378989 RepID=A0ABV6A5M6_9PSEU
MDVDRQINNTLKGEVTGTSIQAGIINGDIHVYERQYKEEFRSLKGYIPPLLSSTIEDLSSSNPFVRISAVEHSDEIGQENPELRQAVINIFCAYLRLPRLGIDAFNSGQPDKECRQEIQVRFAIQECIRKHLSLEITAERGPDGYYPPQEQLRKFLWSDMSLNLSGATLVDFDLSGCSIDEVNFRATRFIGNFADFRSSIFYERPKFDLAQFRCPAQFSSAYFNRGASLKEAQFYCAASFQEAYFTGPIYFDEAYFTYEPLIKDCRYS